MRLLGTIAGITLLLLAILISGRIALSSLFLKFAKATGNLAISDQAVRLAPQDAEAHFVRAEVLKVNGGTAEVAGELERAAVLRPRDYFFWLQLGLARDEAGDQAAALAAFDEAVRLAPQYAQPRWQRGNLLIRSGNYDEAFDDLRRAAKSDPALVPSLIDLSWGIARGDSKTAEQLAEPGSSKMRMAFAEFLAGHGKGKEALEQFRQALPVSEQGRNKLVRQLIDANAFAEAFMVWKNLANENSTEVYDGGFEGPLSLAETGFGWRVSQGQSGVNLSLDPRQAHSGGKSLRIGFSGDSNPDSSLVSQLIVVEPSRRYRISFAARTQDVVTGGLPLVTVNDAAGQHKRLGQSAQLREGGSDWQILSFEFTAEPSTNAITLSLRRENCSASPCPIFGYVWLDSFSIELLK